MKTFLAWWIVIQLFVIGGTVGKVRYETSINQYDCREDHTGDEFIGMLFPLIVFVPMDQVIERYCEGKR